MPQGNRRGNGRMSAGAPRVARGVTPKVGEGSAVARTMRVPGRTGLDAALEARTTGPSSPMRETWDETATRIRPSRGAGVGLRGDLERKLMRPWGGPCQ